MNRNLKTGLIAGLLIAVLVFAGSCLAPATTTASGAPVQQTWLEKYGVYLFFVAIIAMFYFIMIRPQRNRQKKQQEMIATLQKGSRVITAGGIFGVIDTVREDSFVIKVEGGSLLRVAKGSVMAIPDQPPQK